MKSEEIISNDEQNQICLDEISRLMDLDPEANSKEGVLLNVIAKVVEAFEKKHYPIELPSPLEAVKFRMEQGDLKQKDLVKYFGCRSRVSEFLSGKRPLSLKIIRKLNAGLGISTNVLFQPSEPNGKIKGKTSLKKAIK